MKLKSALALKAGLPIVALLAASALPAAQPAPAPAASPIEGTWDLTWQTRHGPRQSGWLVLRVTGNQVVGEMHGRGSVTARGSMTENGFILRGTRMLVPYTVEGRITGARMDGRFRAMSVERRFTATRR
jgi:hypothetical protein